jgi:simple sugar transport system permease protein
MNESLVVETLVAAVALGTPLVWATVGEIITERAGILNLGVNGMMLVGAVAGFWANYEFENVWLGVIAALIAGALIASLHAITSVTLRVNQIVSGLALAILGGGLSAYIGQAAGLVGEPPVTEFKPIITGGIAEWPIVGPLLFGHDPLVYLSWIFVGVAAWYLFRTKLGLSLRAVGEDPASADSAGVNVTAVRYIHTMIGGAAAGIGGAYFSLRLVPSWQDDMVAGRGWIAIALVIFAVWRPWRALFAAYLFGAVERIALVIQVEYPNVDVPAQILAMLPFVLTIVVMLMTTSGARAKFFGAPAALGIPYNRESR